MKTTLNPHTGRHHRPAILTQDAPAGSLFAPEAHARADGPETSKEAARAVASRADAQCADLLALLKTGQWTSSGLRRQCMERGILNLTARISDLRNQGHRIEVEKGVYRLVP